MESRVIICSSFVCEESMVFGVSESALLSCAVVLVAVSLDSLDGSASATDDGLVSDVPVGVSSQHPGRRDHYF